MVFWVAIIFVLGTGMWIAMSSSIYIFAGLTRVPLIATPYDGFFNLRILQRLERLSSRLILTTVVTMITVIAVLEVFAGIPNSESFTRSMSYPGWLTKFMLVVTAVILFALKFGSTRRFFIALSVIYAPLAIVSSGKELYLMGTSVSIGLLCASAFFAGLVAYQTSTIGGFLREFVQRSKEEAATPLSDAITSVAATQHTWPSDPAAGRDMDVLIRLHSMFGIVDRATLGVGPLRSALRLAAPIFAAAVAQLVAESVLELLRV